MGSGGSKASLDDDLQMSCPDFIMDEDIKTAQHVENIHQQILNAQTQSNSIEGTCHKSQASGNSSSKPPVSLGLGSDGFSFSDGKCVHDFCLGDQDSSDNSLQGQRYLQCLKCRQQKENLGWKQPLGLSERQFGMYSYVTEHAKQHQYVNFNDSLLHSYPALTGSTGDVQCHQDLMDSSRNQTDSDKIEVLKVNTQTISQNVYGDKNIPQNGCDRIPNGFIVQNMPKNDCNNQELSENGNNEKFSLDPLQSNGFFICPKDSVTSSEGFVMSSNHQSNSSCARSSSNDFAPPGDIDIGRYNDFFAGAVAKPPVPSSDCNSSLQSGVVNLTNQTGSSSSSSETILKLEFAHLDRQSLTRSIGWELQNDLFNKEPAWTPIPETVYPSLIGYCSSFGGDTLSNYRRSEEDVTADTGEFQPCSIDPDLSSKSHLQSVRSQQRSNSHQQQYQSDTYNIQDFSSVNNANNNADDEARRRVLRTCSGYSSCSNGNYDNDDGTADSSMTLYPSVDEYGAACDDDTERHNSCLSSDSQYEFVYDEGTQQQNNYFNINNGKEDLENVVPDNNLIDNLVDHKESTADSFKKVEDDELTFCQVETRPDALCIYDGIANRPVMFSALMCVAPKDVDTFAMSFLCKLKSWGFSIFLPIRDLNLTGPYHENLARVIKERCNGKLIVIVSKDYPKSDECLFLTYYAKTLDPAAHQRNIIPIFIDKNIADVPNVLNGLSSIQYNQAVRNQFLRKRLNSALGVRA